MVCSVDLRQLDWSVYAFLVCAENLGLGTE